MLNFATSSFCREAFLLLISQYFLVVTTLDLRTCCLIPSILSTPLLVILIIGKCSFFSITTLLVFTHLVLVRRGDGEINISYIHSVIRVRNYHNHFGCMYIKSNFLNVLGCMIHNLSIFES